MKKLFVHFATLGPIGYFPAPGTCATLVTVPLVFALQQSAITYGAFVLIGVPIFLYCIHRALTQLNQGNDPQQVVLDEVIGCLIVFAGISLSANAMSVGLIVFRALDIFKPWPIKWFETLPGVWGNVLDDVVAAVVANIVLRLVV